MTTTLRGSSPNGRSRPGALGEQGCLDQANWLAATLAKADSDPGVATVIAVTHQPPFTNAALHSGWAFVRTTILPVLARHEKVAALFSGHTHAYERFSSHGMHCVVSGGGGAPLMSVIRTSPVSAPTVTTARARSTTAGSRARCEVVMLVADGTWKVVDSFALRRLPD